VVLSPKMRWMPKQAAQIKKITSFSSFHLPGCVFRIIRRITAKLSYGFRLNPPAHRDPRLSWLRSVQYLGCCRRARLLPVSVDASRPSARTIMGVVDNALNDRSEMLGDAHNQSTRGKLVRPQMNCAPRPYLHRRRPLPAKRFHDPLDCGFVNSGPRIACTPLAFAHSFASR
jgi:hypothetical protein